MEARWVIDVLPYVGSAEDEFGNPTTTWATTPVRRSVYGWAPAGTNEATASRQTVTADIVLYAPSEFTLDPRDRVRLLGQTYEVQGDVESFDHGPFGYTPGVRVNLRRYGDVVPA
jgi:hypothetical protein